MASPSPRAPKKTKSGPKKGSELNLSSIPRPVAALRRSNTTGSSSGGPQTPARSASMGRSRPMTPEEESELLGDTTTTTTPTTRASIMNVEGGDTRSRAMSDHQKRDAIMGGSEIMSSTRRGEAALMSSSAALASTRRRASGVDSAAARWRASAMDPNRGKQNLETSWKRTNLDTSRKGASSLHDSSIKGLHDSFKKVSHDSFKQELRKKVSVNEPPSLRKNKSEGSQDDDAEGLDDSLSSLPGLTELKEVKKALPLGASLRSSVAPRFLENDSDSDDGGGFDLGASMGLAKYTATLSQQAQATTAPSNDADKLSSDDPKRGSGGLLETIGNSLHSLRDLQMSFTTRGGQGGGKNESDSEDDLVDFEEEPDLDELFENPFERRKQMRAVDQSINLMNAAEGKYDWSNRGSRGSRDQRIRNKAMALLFLGGGDSRSSDKSVPPKKQSKKRSYFSSFCYMICSKTFLLVAGLVVMIFLLVSPVIWDQIAGSSDSGNDNNSSSSSDFEASNAIITKPPTVSPVATPEEESSSDISDSPFYTAKEIQQRRDSLVNILSSVDYVDSYTDSPAAKEAISWITAYDPAQVEIPENKEVSVTLLQRYAMSVLFFDTHPKVPASTAPHATITSRTASSVDKEENTRRRELSRIKFLDWMTATHVCEWEGLTCNDEHEVVEVDLSNSRMRGSLPPELGLLGKSLVAMDLSGNRLSGRVPDKGWGELTSLESLKLHKNALTGSINGDVCWLQALDTFTSDCKGDLECDCCSKCF